jgi:NAD(P)-dependent dehydrogenase (short-subunit alcohol dehydrogenase family)
MKLRDQVVVVTGGGRGIGAALCRRFAAEGAAVVVVADVDGEAALAVASEIGGEGRPLDVTEEPAVAAMVAHVVREHGRIDLYCSNAGIALGRGPETEDADWQRIWDVNTMSHVLMARHVVPAMLAAGGGYLLGTISAAGLLNALTSAPYGMTKAAALSFFEWLAIAYGDRIRVSCLCPQGVRTRMLELDDGMGALLRESALTPEEVAGAVVAGLAEERFLILPHPEVATYFERKASDYDRWLRGMRRLRATVAGTEP